MLARPLALVFLAATACPGAHAFDATALTDTEIAAIQALRCDGAFDEALASLDAHEAVKAENAEALALRGLVLLDTDRAGAARLILAQKFRSARVLDDALTNTFVGRMRLGLGEAKRAQSRFAAALQYDDSCAEARFLADASAAMIAAEPAPILALREFDAKDALPKGLAETIVAWVARRVGLERAEDGASDDGTLALLRIALESGDENADVQLVCARVLHHRGEAEAADELLDDVAKRRPHRMQDVLYQRALAQSERGEREAAFETVNSAVVLGKDHNDVLLLASELALDLNKLEDASRLLSLLESRFISIEVDRLYSRYCLERAEAIPADDKEKRGNRIVLLREAEKRCVSGLKKERFDVECLERLLRVSELLGERSKVELDEVAKQLEKAKLVQQGRAKRRGR